MIGKELIELIKSMNLEDEEIYISNGYTDSGDIILNQINTITKSDEWNGGRYYIK